jgi:hypothetical protein
MQDLHFVNGEERAASYSSRTLWRGFWHFCRYCERAAERVNRSIEDNGDVFNGRFDDDCVFKHCVEQMNFFRAELVARQPSLEKSFKQYAF